MRASDKLHAEAAAAGLVLVGPGRDRNYRTYRVIECGHEMERATFTVRSGRFRCQQCVDAKLHAEAANAGLVLMGPGRDQFHRAYRWIECGHEHEYQLGNVRTTKVQCKVCVETNLRAEAEVSGLVLMGAGRSAQRRIYRWIECGHETEYSTGAVRRGSVRCQQCLDSSLHAEAAAAGLALLGAGRNSTYRTYRWIECGHEADYSTFHVRAGTARCQQCDATAWGLPSNVYVLVLTDGPNAWVKVGSAKRTATRIKEYGLPASVEVQIVRETPTATGEAAYRIEQEIKDRFAAYRLGAEQMRVWHDSGFTECYQIAALDQILAAVA